MTQQFPITSQPCSRTRQWSSDTPSDAPQHLAQLEAKLQMVRDRVVSVAKGYTTGMYLHGEGGVGKSFTVVRELDRLRCDYQLFNSHMTGRGLYDQLKKLPGSVHVLEDMEPLFRDKSAPGVLRGALWATPREGTGGRLERLVTWTIFGDADAFLFTGGLIIIGNRPIDDVPELRAVKTRIACLHLEVTRDEIQALMRRVAGEGYRHGDLRLEPDACLDVCEFIIQQAALFHRPLDMRLLINSLNDRVQWEEHDSSCHWKDLVTARLREGPTALANEMVPHGREARKQQELAILAEIVAATPNPQEQLRGWEERTGKSRATFYRRMAEIGGYEFSPSGT